VLGEDDLALVGDILVHFQMSLFLVACPATSIIVSCCSMRPIAAL
jgi:hypothetical protein